MPKRIEGVSVRLLRCAKEEFLEKGFLGASIRMIAQKAETSPRAVYTRFPDKEGLFEAIIGSTLAEFMKMFRDGFSAYWGSEDKIAEKPLFDAASAEGYIALIDYAYDHRDEFILLLTCSDGTKYSNFIKDLTNINREHHDMGGVKTDNPHEDAIMEKLFYVLAHSFYAGMFEPLLDGMTRGEARIYVRHLFGFFMSGARG